MAITNAIKIPNLFKLFVKLCDSSLLLSFGTMISNAKTSIFQIMRKTKNAIKVITRFECSSAYIAECLSAVCHKRAESNTKNDRKKQQEIMVKSSMNNFNNLFSKRLMRLTTLLTVSISKKGVITMTNIITGLLVAITILSAIHNQLYLTIGFGVLSLMWIGACIAIEFKGTKKENRS